MNPSISLTAVGHASSLFLSISFVLCIGFDLLFPEHTMYQAWRDLLPGFEWLSWTSFFIGLLQAYLYGWYFALVWVSIYNVFATRARRAPEDETEWPEQSGHDPGAP